jgi:two-component system LytT family sensor kinase
LTTTFECRSKLQAVTLAKDSELRKWLVRLGLFVGLWTVFALMSGVSTYQHQLSYDKPVSWALAMRRSFKESYAFGFLAIGILALGRCVPLKAERLPRWLAVHVPVSILFVPVYVALVSWLEAGEQSVQTGAILTFSYLFGKLISGYFVGALFMYWVVVLGQLVWSSYQRSRQQEMEQAELRRQLVEARLDALRMQLNPHFLFNTLHTISALIHENPEAADQVVARLSELLRQSLDQSKAQEVPLHQELAFLDRYLEIEQTRFAERLDVQREVATDVKDALVPFLILQPLVENAIRHGIEQREEKGRLAIRAQRQNGRLELSVTDNGNGLPETDDAPREGIGLSNTRSRLRHLYGDDQTLELHSVAGGGLEARISIPYRQ